MERPAAIEIVNQECADLATWRKSLSKLLRQKGINTVSEICVEAEGGAARARVCLRDVVAARDARRCLQASNTGEEEWTVLIVSGNDETGATSSGESQSSKGPARGRRQRGGRRVRAQRAAREGGDGVVATFEKKSFDTENSSAMPRSGRSQAVTRQCNTHTGNSGDGVATGCEPSSGRRSNVICGVHTVPQDEVSLNHLFALPNVIIRQRQLDQEVKSLLKIHNGRVPLLSIVKCYEATFGRLRMGGGGVSLEHLLTKVPGVFIEWEDARNPRSKVLRVGRPATELTEDGDATSNLVLQLSGLSRATAALNELDVGGSPRGKGGRNGSPEGVKRLGDNFQILGFERLQVTLSADVQTARFREDILELVTARAGNLPLKDLNEAFRQHYDLPLELRDYGVCFIDDILEYLRPEVRVEGNGVLVVAAKKSDTVNLEKLARNVWRLLSRFPRCRLQLSSLAETWRSQFGEDLTGVTSGIHTDADLQHLLPELLHLESENGRIFLALVASQRLIVFAKQLQKVLVKKSIQTTELQAEFLLQQKYWPIWADYEAENVEGVLNQLSFLARQPHGVVELLPADEANGFVNRLLILLMEQEHVEDGVNLSFLETVYNTTYSSNVSLLSLVHCTNLMQYIELRGVEHGTLLFLKPLQLFARNLREVLLQREGTTPLTQLYTVYMQVHHRPIEPRRHDAYNVSQLLSFVSNVVYTSGPHMSKNICLHQDFRLSSAEHSDRITDRFKEAARKIRQPFASQCDTARRVPAVMAHNPPRLNNNLPDVAANASLTATPASSESDDDLREMYPRPISSTQQSGRDVSLAQAAQLFSAVSVNPAAATQEATKGRRRLAASFG